MSYPHLVVSVLCRDNDRILMVREKDNGITCWNQPAGHVEYGESVTDAALREALEESGYQVELTGLQGLYQNLHQGNGTHYLRISFYARALTRASRELDPDIIEAQWLKLDDLLAGKYPLRSELTRRCLEDCRNAPIYPVSLINDFLDGVPE